MSILAGSVQNPVTRYELTFQVNIKNDKGFGNIVKELLLKFQGGMMRVKLPILRLCTLKRWLFIRPLNPLRPRQDGRRFPGDILKWIFLNENAWISIKISLKFVPMCQIYNIPELVQILAWRRPGDKPLSEQMMVILLMHLCVIRPQWVKQCKPWANHPFTFRFNCSDLVTLYV